MSPPPLSSLGFSRTFGRVLVFWVGFLNPPEGEQYQIPTGPGKRNCCLDGFVNSADETLRATLLVSSYLT